jgi:hypothetical protein
LSGVLKRLFNPRQKVVDMRGPSGSKRMLNREAALCAFSSCGVVDVACFYSIQVLVGFVVGFVVVVRLPCFLSLWLNPRECLYVWLYAWCATGRQSCQRVLRLDLDVESADDIAMCASSIAFGMWTSSHSTMWECLARKATTAKSTRWRVVRWFPHSRGRSLFPRCKCRHGLN